MICLALRRSSDRSKSSSKPRLRSRGRRRSRGFRVDQLLFEPAAGEGADFRPVRMFLPCPMVGIENGIPVIKVGARSRSSSSRRRFGAEVGDEAEAPPTQRADDDDLFARVPNTSEGEFLMMCTSPEITIIISRKKDARSRTAAA